MLEPKEFKNAFIDRRGKTQAPFVRADGLVELYTPTTVDLNLAVVIFPCDAKFDAAIWLCEPFQDRIFAHIGLIKIPVCYRTKNFADGLMKLWLIGVGFFELGEEFFTELG